VPVTSTQINIWANSLIAPLTMLGEPHQTAFYNLSARQPNEQAALETYVLQIAARSGFQRPAKNPSAFCAYCVAV